MFIVTCSEKKAHFTHKCISSWQVSKARNVKSNQCKIDICYSYTMGTRGISE